MRRPNGSAQGAASHQPITNPATDKTTVYLQASTAGCIKEVVTCQRLTTTLHPTWTGEVSGAPASRRELAEDSLGSPIK